MRQLTGANEGEVNIPSPPFWSRIGRLPGKIGRNLALLRRDPEQFGRNLRQFTDPELFERRLIDVLDTVPMHVRFDPAAPGAPRLNVLGGSWAPEGMTGGPNTVLNLALRVAREGIAVRIVSTVQTLGPDPAWLRRHAEALLGGAAPDVEIASSAAAETKLPLGPGDLFLATHWTTAQQIARVLPLLPERRFFYLLQDFEPGFYAWSSNYARVLETYGMSFWPIINESLLAEYLFSQPYGRLSDQATREQAIVFEPAVDSALFYPDPVPAPRRNRLLFYARPTNPRNLFGLGLMALRAVAGEPAFAGWEFLSIGSRGSIPELGLCPGPALRPAPWMDYAGYADLLRSADILLCPMLSPHTSYPVLEMVACGGLCVTNTFQTKTASALAAISPAIVATEPTVAGLAEGLRRAADRVNAGEVRPAPPNLPRNWAESLDPAARRIAETIRARAGQRGDQAESSS